MPVIPPATRPTVLETLATNGGNPKNSNVGKVIRVPAPTMVLMVPAAIPAASRAITSYQGTRQTLTRATGCLRTRVPTRPSGPIQQRAYWLLPGLLRRALFVVKL